MTVAINDAVEIMPVRAHSRVPPCRARPLMSVHYSHATVDQLHLDDVGQSFELVAFSALPGIRAIIVATHRQHLTVQLQRIEYRYRTDITGVQNKIRTGQFCHQIFVQSAVCIAEQNNFACIRAFQAQAFHRAISNRSTCVRM